MSSMVRRMQIRQLKAMGFRRLKFRVVRDLDGSIDRVPVLRGGAVADPTGKLIGYNWPRRVSV